MKLTKERKNEIVFFLLLLFFSVLSVVFFRNRNLENVCNDEGSWNLIKSQNLVKFGGLLLILFMLYLWYTSEKKLARYGWVLVLTGGVSNLYERFYFGCVTDYWKVASFWPAFNLADGIIVAGVVLLVYDQLKIKKGNSE